MLVEEEIRKDHTQEPIDMKRRLIEAQRQHIPQRSSGSRWEGKVRRFMINEENSKGWRRSFPPWVQQTRV
ncbi:hypothetical protein GDO81_022801 [Engystomops pustulosus]|uniref:Disabled homolog 2-interacting protein C-terminal domain-containing protein n=2 Tax=Engystomops pustulosus TaxID=76066 RepID=A0AAV6ZJ26_ENGPU|nr:hypothetical protein GDO81_022801 [Engystomops pustulosus]